jgi:hypothetical protein
LHELYQTARPDYRRIYRDWPGDGKDIIPARRKNFDVGAE